MFKLSADCMYLQEMAALRANRALDPALTALLAADMPEAGGPHIAVVEVWNSTLRLSKSLGSCSRAGASWHCVAAGLLRRWSSASHRK